VGVEKYPILVCTLVCCVLVAEPNLKPRSHTGVSHLSQYLYLLLLLRNYEPDPQSVDICVTGCPASPTRRAFVGCRIILVAPLFFYPSKLLLSLWASAHVRSPVYSEHLFSPTHSYVSSSVSPFNSLIRYGVEENSERASRSGQRPPSKLQCWYVDFFPEFVLHRFFSPRLASPRLTTPSLITSVLFPSCFSSPRTISSPHVYIQLISLTSSTCFSFSLHCLCSILFVFLWLSLHHFSHRLMSTFT
jgi:hypothetical protein